MCVFLDVRVCVYFLGVCVCVILGMCVYVWHVWCVCKYMRIPSLRGAVYSFFSIGACLLLSIKFSDDFESKNIKACIEVSFSIMHLGDVLIVWNRKVVWHISLCRE